jgi:type VI secretion system ImpA/VasJ family protein
VASRWEPAVRCYELAQGIDWYTYKDSVRIPTEEEAAKEYDKKGVVRRQAIEDGKTTPEELDDALRATPSEQIQALVDEGGAALEAVQSFTEYCDEKFGEDGPNFHPLKTAIEDVISSARILLDRKGVAAKSPPSGGAKSASSNDPFGSSSSSSPFGSSAPAGDPFGSNAPVADPFGSNSPASDAFGSSAPASDAFGSSASVPAEDAFGSPAPSAEAADPFGSPPASDLFGGSTAAPAPSPDPWSAPAPAAAPAFSAPPPGDPIGAIAAGALALREKDATNPAPYLALRGLRWGELRASGGEIDDLLLEAPPRETRVALKRLAREESWEEVLATAEQAMSQPCGRGWLDIQRYAVEACEALGDEYDRVSQAVRTQLWLLLNDYPDLPERTLDDDTPAANGATLAWIRSLGEAGLPVPPRTIEPEDEDEDEPDAWQIAQREMQRGRTDEALAVLRRQLGRETSERARFERQVQMARVCLASKSEAVALPILEDLNTEIERHGLTEWEDAEMISEPLELLHRCLMKVRPDDQRLSKIYDQLCRLDPLRAMRLAR